MSVPNPLQKQVWGRAEPSRPAGEASRGPARLFNYTWAALTRTLRSGAAGLGSTRAAPPTRPAAARAARRGGARRARRSRGRACGGRTRRRRRALRGRGRRALRSPRAGAPIMSWWRAALSGTRLIRRGSGSARQLGRAAGAAASGMGNSTSSSLGNSATAPVNQIQETISDNCVVIFSKTSCSYCTMAKKLFHDMNVNYKVVELDMLEHGSQFQDALYKMTGERTVPRIFVNGTFIGGATDTHRLHKEGKLLPLVHQCYLKKSKRKEFQ